MEKARYNTELYSNLKVPLDNVKPSNFWGSYHCCETCRNLVVLKLTHFAVRNPR